MYTILIVVLLILSVATFFLSKSRPVFKPVGFVLPIVAILILIFKPGGQDALSVSQKVLDEEAKGVGEQLARVITNTIPKKGLILVIHPEESAPTYSLGRVEEHLQGLEDALESSGYPLSTHSLVEQDAVNDPLTDGIYIGSPTLRKLAASQNDPVGIVLLGLHFAAGDEASAALLPPLVLATIGDPATSEDALARGFAVAALFEKVNAPLNILRDTSLTAEERFNRRYEVRTANR